MLVFKKQPIVVFFLFVMLTAGCYKDVASPPGDKIATPSVRVRDETLKLGSFKTNQEVTAPVSVINETDDPVELKLLTLSCGCMSSDFSPRTLPPKSDYTFNVAISTVGLGDGWQSGIIQTDFNKYSELNFRVEYNIQSATYLFPDNFLLSKKWQAGKKWPLQIEFALESLDEPMELVKPLYIESDYGKVYQSPIIYSLPSCSKLYPDSNIVVQMDRGGFKKGMVRDEFYIVAEGKDDKLKFKVGVSGNLSVE